MIKELVTSDSTVAEIARQREQSWYRPLTRLSTLPIKAIYPFWLLAGFLTLTFAMGGASRADVQSLLILRPASILVLGVGVLGLTFENVRDHRFVYVLMGALLLVVGLQLIPLPPVIWQSLPGRELIVQIDRAAQLGDVWRPLTMVPTATWNAFYALYIPAVVVVVGSQLTPEDHSRTLILIIILGLFSGVLGLLQVVGPPGGPLYLYAITSEGSSVGLFANRNHQAVFLACLFPMLAVFAFSGVRTVEQMRLRAGLGIAFGILLVPLLLVTGSRAGLICGLIGLASVPVLYHRPNAGMPTKRKAARARVVVGLGGLAVVILGLLTALFARAQAFDRLIAKDRTEDLRFAIWGPISRMAWKYFPTGSGVGSFAEIYQIDEPNALLSRNYVNQAHNDLLDVFLTSGAPGLCIVLVALAAWAYASWRIWSLPVGRGSHVHQARPASVILLMLGLASLSDYPLRVPSIMSVAALAALWLSRFQSDPRPGRSISSGIASNTPLAAGRKSESRQ